ncbi:MAG: formylglycine-generating enzyme family protein, partial [Sandaracinaceae bacterium]|nr:formylglycine-generating enzyme family protein [Sandaracinaceae bacterium]
DQRARLKARVDPLRWQDDRQSRALVERFDAGLERGEDGMTDSTRRALAYWTEKLAKQRLAQGLGPLAEARKDICVSVDAPELAGLDAWCRCSDARRDAIARAIEKAAEPFALRFAGLERPHDVPIAIFAHGPTGMRACLVPGGELVRGFSEREERIVREASARNEGIGNHYEEYGYLLDQAPAMRPVARVRVQPFLVFERPSEPREPAEVTVMLQELPFRLMTETEHEHAERAGRVSELTWDGDAIPGEAWMLRVQAEQLRNRFGLTMLGLYPEACADLWAPSYEAAPADGSARLGEGRRVVRGGALMVSPWQACGEWQLLTNAVRGTSAAWEYFLSIRPALGIRLS